MALTIGAQTRVSNGARFVTTTAITTDTSYPAGGWSLTAAQLGLPLGLIDNVEFLQSGITAVGSIDLQYDVANQKLMAFSGGSATTAAPEVTATTDIHAALAKTVIVATGR